MGGDDWENWIDILINVELFVEGCKMIVFFYMGFDVIYFIYLDGILGCVKIDLY